MLRNHFITKKPVASPNLNAGTRSAEKTKTDKHKLLCQQLGMDFVSIILTASGGMRIFTTSGAVPEADSGRSTGIHPANGVEHFEAES